MCTVCLVEKTGPGASIAERVRALREERGWSQRMLGSRAGLSSAYVSTLEKGEIPNPGADAITLLAGALGIHPVELLGELPPGQSHLPLYCEVLEQEPELQELLAEGWAYLDDNGRQSVLRHFRLEVDSARKARVLGRRPSQGKKRGTRKKAGEGEGEESERAIVSPEIARGE